VDMQTDARPYTSGNWLVKPDQVEAFLERWQQLIDHTLENCDVARSFVLIRDTEDPRHFLSFGEWSDVERMNAFRGQRRFRALFAGCLALCESFTSGDYRLTSMSAGPSGS
jgi:quinol monooxygenase YgiN